MSYEDELRSEIHEMQEAIDSDDYMYDSLYEHRLWEKEQRLKEIEKEELEKLERRLGRNREEVK